ncbi:MAG: PspC domain-containing protein, partial [Rhodoglobus sp.]
MPSKTKPDVTPPPAPTSTKERFFEWMRSIGIRREPGWIGGVGSGIATRLGIDPLIVRGIIVVAAILGGPAFLLYAAAWLLLP